MRLADDFSRLIVDDHGDHQILDWMLKNDISIVSHGTCSLVKRTVLDVAGTEAVPHSPCHVGSRTNVG
jgi:hypothetical protein